jgi:hypothetical protein
MLPAGCGDCLWLEYGRPGEVPRVVLIDGGVRNTITPLRTRIEAACRERKVDTIDIELLVVTHIDNDHILGILELLGDPKPLFRVKDIWFNGRPQLMRLPAEAGGSSLPPDLLGTRQGDDLSHLLETRGLKWNVEWDGNPIFVPDTGSLPVVTLDGQLTLTLLGPTLSSLHDLRAKWIDVLGGDEELVSEAPSGPADLLGRSDTWPPVWSDYERRDPSVTNGSSIMLLAEYPGHSVLLTGDGHASDLTAALERLRGERNLGARAFPLSAFKLPHHGSSKNLDRELMENVDCSRYLISTDGSMHRHPDHQALLRLLRYSKQTPELLFNYEVDTTRPWRDSKRDVLDDSDLRDYVTRFPVESEEGLVLELD